jgi:CDP-4-dehydro-6-deoxyglucose reductase, E3
MAWDPYPFRVRSSTAVTPVIRELWLSPDTAGMPYLPGQYALLSDRHDEVPPRSYSIANAPRADGAVSLLVTRVPQGRTSNWAHDLVPGDAVTLIGPYGTFVPDRERTGPVLLLAAGSGLAPARALAEALLAEPSPRAVTLVFSARTGDDAIDRARFGGWASARDDFRYLLTLTREPRAPEGRRIPDLLADVAGDLCGWEVFASGPPGFVTGCAAAARALRADPGAVHTEEFFTEPVPWTGAPAGSGEASTGR